MFSSDLNELIFWHSPPYINYHKWRFIETDVIHNTNQIMLVSSKANIQIPSWLEFGNIYTFFFGNFHFTLLQIIAHFE